MIDQPETWKNVPDFPDYEVSTAGRVRRCSSRTAGKAGHLLKLSVRQPKTGHVTVQLWRDGRSKTITVSRLMALAFIGPPPTADHQAAHNDGNPANNVPSNIRWATNLENAADRRMHGRNLIGERHPAVILTEDRVRRIRQQHAQGMSLAALGQLHGVHLGTVWRLVKRLTWQHVE